MNLIYTATKSSAVFFLGRVEDPIKKVSTWCAASRPSEIAQTMRDCPRRTSPAAKIFFFAVW